MTYKILIPIGCRSDEGLSDPIIGRLEKEDWCEVKTIKLEPQNFILSYQKAEYYCKGMAHIGNSHPFKPDLILITGDRVEMCAAACAAFHNNVKIAHLYAGVVNDPITTFDDISRHCITLWSDIQLCENEEARSQVEALLYPLNWSNSHVVGITHLDDLEIDESKVPQKLTKTCDVRYMKTIPYDLILYNTPTRGVKDYTELQDIVGFLNTNQNRYSVLVGGNPDGDKETAIIDWVDEFFIDLPRPQFLGLLKNCHRFITNSSSAIYEAPYFLKPEQIIMIGDRNKNRPKVDCKPGGSDKIVSILKEYAQNNSMNKVRP